MLSRRFLHLFCHTNFGIYFCNSRYFLSVIFDKQLVQFSIYYVYCQLFFVNHLLTKIYFLDQVITGNVLLSRAVSRQVSSALKSLTSVFGMGTGVSSSLLSPDYGSFKELWKLHRKQIGDILLGHL